MKNQTKNTNTATNVGKIYKGIFSLKTVVLLAVLAFTGFSFEAKAQSIHLTVNNTASAGCDWNVRAFKSGSPIMTAFPSAGGSGVKTTGCIFSEPDEIMVTKGLCTVIFYAPFTYTAYTPPCSGSCSSTIDCSGGTPNICGPNSNDWVIVVQIQ